MSLSSLQVLADNRDALLLAEVAAWLHDMGKCADEHIINQASNKPAGYSYRYKTAQSSRLPASLSVAMLGESVAFQELIEKGMPRVIGDTSQPWLLRALGRCHSVAHVEKELDENDQSTKQPKDNTRLSNAFGIEANAVNGLTARLNTLPFASLTDRALFVPKVQEVFGKAFGDTRRPVNEVTLADWSGAVAALYKSALAGALLGIKPDPDALHWRILRVNFDVLSLYAKAIKIADLLAYRRAVNVAFKVVKHLVEWKYPLGNEVYRDTTGIYFTFPDLDLPADLAQEIRRRLEGIEPELAPRIAITQGDGATAQEQLKGILGKARREALENLRQPFDAANLTSCWQQLWKTVSREKNWEVCPLCGLRPKEEHEEVCAHCEQRRKPRLKKWEKKPAKTIWLGEIADHNDRVALLVGKFGLEDWLSGDLVQTMLVKAVENNPGACVPKNPSPARLRRVWETCQRFWSSTVKNLLTHHPYGAKADHADLRCYRFALKPDNCENWQENFAYNGTVEVRREGKISNHSISLLWQPNEKVFLTISNVQTAGKPETWQAVTVRESDEPRSEERTFQVKENFPASSKFAKYQPFLSLPASPDQFLAFVPAADALDIVKGIREQYETQFGKVRNRLLLFLRLVYFERKMPLMAVMDAARAMLDTLLRSEQWTVKSANGNGHLEFDNGIVWNVPTTMGDGKTEETTKETTEETTKEPTKDHWYPYWCVEGKPTDRTRWFIGPDGEHWVHVTDLKPGDTVRLTPSRFDFLWLDTAARRFAIAYDEKGRRLDRPSRPFYLDDLDRLEATWNTFNDNLSKTQMKQVLQTIEATRERWFGRDEGQQSIADATFRQFVEDTLANAQWNWKTIPGEEKEQLITAAVRGELADLAELHLEILKEKKE